MRIKERKSTKESLVRGGGSNFEALDGGLQELWSEGLVYLVLFGLSVDSDVCFGGVEELDVVKLDQGLHDEGKIALSLRMSPS